MNDDAASQKQEIVIVRRRGGDDAAAGKGGSWKIAYADFVTAMMAFFLVMWLINASNEKTRAQVASYFNPIKLTDSSTGNRGLRDKKDAKTTKGGDAVEVSAGGTPPAPSDTRREAELLADPDSALSKIEAKLMSMGSAAGGLGPLVEQVPSAYPSESQAGVGDPFDPRAWEKRQSETSMPNVPVNADAKIPTEPETQAPAAKLTEQVRQEAPDRQVDATPRHDSSAPGVTGSEQQEKHLADAQSIAEDIAKRLGTGLDVLPASVDVKWTDEGMLISLTDKQNFGMFLSGSAEPEPELVRLVTAVAGALAARPGYIVVRGHTDSRPYRNKKYDNWQLSTARAHLAQYMLVRGGLDDTRIRRVEGLADREPRILEDPQAPENRRIEILLGSDTK